MESLLAQRADVMANDIGGGSMGALISGQGGRGVGKKTSFPESLGHGHEHANWDFIGGRSGMELSRKHDSGNVASHPVQDHHQYSRTRHPETRPDQGTHATRFHRGFARRGNADIVNDQPRIEYEDHVQGKSLRHEDARRARLSELNEYNAFNPISGEFDPSRIRKGMAGLEGTLSFDAGFRSQAKATAMHPHMHTLHGPDDPGEGNHPELAGPPNLLGHTAYQGSRLPAHVVKVGNHALAQSHYRFFRPAPSGDSHGHRQNHLVHEGGGPSHPTAAGGGNGRVRKQVSGVLGTFRYCDELPSHGIEDQFSKSGYGKDSHEYPDGIKPEHGGRDVGGPYFGLVETRRPGLYTPRKQMERHLIKQGIDPASANSQQQQQQQFTARDLSATQHAAPQLDSARYHHHHQQQQQQQQQFTARASSTHGAGGVSARGSARASARSGQASARASARNAEIEAVRALG